MLNISTLVLGLVQTNCYFISDPKTKSAVVIDPAWDGKYILKTAEQQGFHISQIWLTHAHFDHLGGVAELCNMQTPPPKIALHEDDMDLWKSQGIAPLFGMQIDPGPLPDIKLDHGQKLYLGENEFEVFHTPGHTPGHVVYYCRAEAIVFCGDTIFQGSIGRTDLPGGNYDKLIESIKQFIITLPDETRLLSGHGPETTVGEEKLYNPFLI